jgi:hypothetical protein
LLKRDGRAAAGKPYSLDLRERVVRSVEAAPHVMKQQRRSIKALGHGSPPGSLAIRTTGTDGEP